MSVKETWWVVNPNCIIIKMNQNTEDSCCQSDCSNEEWYKIIALLKLQNGWERLEYSEESWKPKETYCHSLSNERLLVNVIKKSERICKIVGFADHRINLKECEKKYKYLDLARELKKLWNMKVTIVPIVIGAFGTVTKGLLKGPEGFGSLWMSGDYSNDSIAEDGQNTEKCPGDKKRLAVTQTPVRDIR